MRTVAIIQARMGSTRLPGKVLKDISGRSMLAWVISRTRRAQTLDEVVVATSVLPDDDLIVAECEKSEVPSFRGSENDVLDRYYRAALAFRADTVVRITSDCPLIDPAVIDGVVTEFFESVADYACNTLEKGYPRGLNVEVFSREALEEAWRRAEQLHERVHVTPFIYRNPDRFKLRSVPFSQDHSDLRWTVDTEEDLATVRAIVASMNDHDFGWKDALDTVLRNPHLAAGNRGVQQKKMEEA
jgi:spore coat polysaccharide biosynthesis protein SpsF